MAIIFSGMSYYVIRMVFGEEPKKAKNIKEDSWTIVAMLLPLLLVIVGGLYVLPFIQQAVIMAATVIGV